MHPTIKVLGGMMLYHTLMDPCNTKRVRSRKFSNLGSDLDELSENGQNTKFSLWWLRVMIVVPFSLLPLSRINLFLMSWLPSAL